MTRLGKRQLDQLAQFAGVFRAVIVPDKLLTSLVKAGMMEPLSKKSNGFLGLTPAGYRAVADALESGKVVRPPLADWGPKSKQ